MHVAATRSSSPGPLAQPRRRHRLRALQARHRGACCTGSRATGSACNWIPLENHPVWVDDRALQPRLPHPPHRAAAPRQRRAAEAPRPRASCRSSSTARGRSGRSGSSRVSSGDRFAMITKTHHCMIDGAVRRRPRADPPDVARRRSPRVDDAAALPAAPRAVARSSCSATSSRAGAARMPLQDRARPRASSGRDAEDLARELLTRAQALGELARLGRRPRVGDAAQRPPRPAPPLRLARDAARRREGDAQGARTAPSTTSSSRPSPARCATSCMRRGVVPESVDFRVSAPVSVRSEEERGQLGNRVSSWILPLPLDASRTRASSSPRSASVTQRAKESQPGARRRHDDADGRVDAVDAAVARRARDVGSDQHDRDQRARSAVPALLARRASCSRSTRWCR